MLPNVNGVEEVKEGRDDSGLQYSGTLTPWCPTHSLTRVVEGNVLIRLAEVFVQVAVVSVHLVFLPKLPCLHSLW